LSARGVHGTSMHDTSPRQTSPDASPFPGRVWKRRQPRNSSTRGPRGRWRTPPTDPAGRSRHRASCVRGRSRRVSWIGDVGGIREHALVHGFRWTRATEVSYTTGIRLAAASQREGCPEADESSPIFLLRLLLFLGLLYGACPSAGGLGKNRTSIDTGHGQKTMPVAVPIWRAAGEKPAALFDCSGKRLRGIRTQGGKIRGTKGTGNEWYVHRGTEAAHPKMFLERLRQFANTRREGTAEKAG